MPDNSSGPCGGRRQKRFWLELLDLLIVSSRFVQRSFGSIVHYQFTIRNLYWFGFLIQIFVFVTVGAPLRLAQGEAVKNAISLRF
jgi:hypothetical protein